MTTVPVLHRKQCAGDSVYRAGDRLISPLIWRESFFQVLTVCLSNRVSVRTAGQNVGHTFDIYVKSRLME